MTTIQEYLKDWSLSSAANAAVSYEVLQETWSLINYLEATYDEYLPEKGPSGRPFIDRLERWLNAVPAPLGHHRPTLFALVPHIAFFGNAEMEAMSIAAMRGPIATWLLAQKIPILNPSTMQREMDAAISSTAFWSLTDSMDLNGFLKLHNIAGQNFRPNLKTESDKAKPDWMVMTQELSNSSVEHLVVLEDFIGSGEQASMSLPGLLDVCKKPVLLCPLIACATAMDRIQPILAAYPNLQYQPVVVIPDEACVNDVACLNEPDIFDTFRQAVNDLGPLVRGISPGGKWYGPFGFNNKGVLVVLRTNCPDNSLPLIHYREPPSLWEPLFPRVSRV